MKKPLTEKTCRGNTGDILDTRFQVYRLQSNAESLPSMSYNSAHAQEGDLVKRSTEAYIVHHADFMTFLPFRERLSQEGVK